MTSKTLPRRMFLRGLGTAIALPFLDAMTPSSLIVPRAHAAAAARPPLRMAFVYVPNGVHMPSWSPEKEGPLVSLPPILDALSPYRREMLVLSGLTQDKARPNGDGPGDHARAAAAFLTGAQPYKTGGKSIRVGVSVDQVAAAHMHEATRFPSLELGCEGGKQAGSCDSGYSCAYSNNISWKTESMPMAKETNPRLLFERLFPSILTSGKEADLEYKKSILDYVLDDAANLRKKLGATDTRKLDEYLTAIREIEARIARAEKEAKENPDKPPPREARQLAGDIPDDRPDDYGERIRLMGDLLVLTFQADLTRVATFMIANEGSNRSYKNVGVAEGHHSLSHHGKNDDKQQQIERINRFHMEQFAYVVKKLKSVREGSHRLLDSCMVLYGSGISDGDRHNHDELPILLVGRGQGTISTGRHVRYPRNTPLNNLFLAMLARVGVELPSLGDSTGRLEGLL